MTRTHICGRCDDDDEDVTATRHAGGCEMYFANARMGPISIPYTSMFLINYVYCSAGNDVTSTTSSSRSVLETTLPCS